MCQVFIIVSWLSLSIENRKNMIVLENNGALQRLLCVFREIYFFKQELKTGLEHNTEWLTLLCTDNKTIRHTFISVFMHQHCSKYKTMILQYDMGVLARHKLLNLTSRSLSEWARLSRLAGPVGFRTEERPLVSAQNKDPWEEKH